MNPSVAVLLLLVGYALTPAVNAESQDGNGQNTRRPAYLENNHGQLAPYGVGELRREPRALDDPGRERYFRERRLRERWSFGAEPYQQDGIEQERHDRQHSYRNRDGRYGEPDSHRYEGYGDRGYRYYLRPFDDRHRERDPVDFGRFSIRIDDDREPGRTIYYDLPVSPR